MSAMTQGSASRTAVPRTASSPAARTSSTAGRATSGTAGSPSARPAARQVPGLRLVPQRRSTAARAPFVATVVSLLVVGLLGLLVLNTVVNQQSFRLHDLAARGRALEQHEQDLTAALQARSAPAAIAGRATQLGMLPGGAPAFLRLPDGRILGATDAAPAPARPATTPATTPAAHPATKAATKAAVTKAASKAAVTTAATKAATKAPVTTAAKKAPAAPVTGAGG